MFSHVQLFGIPWTIAHQSVQEITLARILEWVVISFSRGSFRPRNPTRVSCIGGGFFPS